MLHQQVVRFVETTKNKTHSANKTIFKIHLTLSRHWSSVRNIGDSYLQETRTCPVNRSIYFPMQEKRKFKTTTNEEVDGILIPSRNIKSENVRDERDSYGLYDQTQRLKSRSQGFHSAFCQWTIPKWPNSPSTNGNAVTANQFTDGKRTHWTRVVAASGHPERPHTSSSI